MTLDRRQALAALAVLTMPPAGRPRCCRSTPTRAAPAVPSSGSPVSPGDADAQRLIDILKPIVMGHDPLRREDLHRRMWGRVRAASVRTISARTTSRCGTSPARPPTCRSMH